MNPDGSIGGFHFSSDFADPAKEPHTSFRCLYGSFFLDWAYPNDLMRAFLGTPNYGLGVMWFRALPTAYIQPSLEPLGLGETVGGAWVRTINENPGGTDGNTFINWLGDPTLRLQVLAPATNLSGNDGTSVTLNWNASADASEYFVYRSTNGLDGPWSKLTSTPVTTTSYTDSSAPSGSKMYQVRALKLIATGSGSYTNLSQGIFKSVN